MLLPSDLTHHKLNGPNCIVCKYQLLCEGQVEGTIALATPTFRPVLLTLPCLSLLDVGYHGNGPYLLLPYQAPEVYDCFW